MIERSFVKENLKNYTIKDHILSNFKRAGISSIEIKRTPLGEKIQIISSTPGLVVGRRGRNVSSILDDLKISYELENPEIEVSEVENPFFDPRIMAEEIANQLERFGPNVFKSAIHRTIEKVMKAGARGVEIVVSGKVPGARAKSWRVSSGHLKKCGDPAIKQVRSAKTQANLKTGTIGIKVKILPSYVILPDDISIKRINREQETNVSGVVLEQNLEEKNKETEKESKPAQNQ